MSVRHAVLTVAAVAVIAACQNPPIHNVDKVPIVAPASVGLNDVERAILIAGSERKWAMRPVAPGRILATHTRSGHTATVDILFDTEQYSIQYVSSGALQDVGSGTIHPTYNRWIQFLEADINKSLALLGASPMPPADPGVQLPAAEALPEAAPGAEAVPAAPLPLEPAPPPVAEPPATPAAGLAI